MISSHESEELMLIAARLRIQPSELRWQEQAACAVESLLQQGEDAPALISFSLDQYDERFRASIPDRFIDILQQLGLETGSLSEPEQAWKQLTRIHIRRVLDAVDPYPSFASWSNEPELHQSYENPICRILIDFGWEYDSQTHPGDPYAEPERKLRTDNMLHEACVHLLKELQ